MKHITVCMECIKEYGEVGRETVVANYYEDAVSYVTCSRGHTSAVVLGSFKFEILLESAAYSLLDGYTLEAASSLASAYERVFEFALNVMAKKANIDANVYLATFKQMSKRSEQQIGAFLILYSLIFGRSYKLSTSIPEERNKIIHQGKIPTPKEVEQFGEKVYAEILKVTKELTESFPDQIMALKSDQDKIRLSSILDSMPIAGSSGTYFFHLHSTNNPQTFSEAMKNFIANTHNLLDDVERSNNMHQWYGNLNRRK